MLVIRLRVFKREERHGTAPVVIGLPERSSADMKGAMKKVACPCRYYKSKGMALQINLKQREYPYDK